MSSDPWVAPMIIERFDPLSGVGNKKYGSKPMPAKWSNFSVALGETGGKRKSRTETPTPNGVELPENEGMELQIPKDSRMELQIPPSVR